MQMIQGVGNATIRDMDLWSISFASGLPDQHQQNALQSPTPAQHTEKDESSKRRRDIPLRDQAPFIDDELPAAIHAQHDSSNQGSKRAGKFTYYFTVGLDAEAAYRCAACLTHPTHFCRQLHTAHGGQLGMKAGKQTGMLGLLSYITRCLLQGVLLQAGIHRFCYMHTFTAVSQRDCRMIGLLTIGMCSAGSTTSGTRNHVWPSTGGRT